MRKELKKLEDLRIKVFGEVQRFGKKHSYKGRDLDTICLVDLKNDKGEVVADHIWLTIGKQIERLNLNIGDKISFDARVKQYFKGYKGRREDVDRPIIKDYKLSNPTKFIKL